ncbi:uncharacterized protein ALTATR162_LOCUS11216 [Alternaria atra]|uniref:AA1-like domain-containing protein n=1 Tax=Alternaria atra TaxID=119953 RepID=A0A8J2IB23_9PLEO|nr:uncharacterized protein ALTATR162_LOCUS11216 [Alternaria atra]CAG5185076.1 unnamed protein product [Alternaria atra]
MQFTLPLLALAAAVSASNPIQPAWNVTRSYRDVSQQVVSFEITAVFVSEEYPQGLESKCSWTEKGQVYGVQCTPDTFSVDPQSDGYTLKVQQTIEKPTKQVAYGEGEVPRKGHAVIPVSAGVA